MRRLSLFESGWAGGEVERRPGCCALPEGAVGEVGAGEKAMMLRY